MGIIINKYTKKEPSPGLYAERKYIKKIGKNQKIRQLLAS